ncbi:Zn-dependent hydrolase [Cryobacterium tepidiphilum]|uniref:Zn-dependent hydrolase n=1 Tax=Cryobacterium tepidiphilum TaxID=2486026 RepID=A0A3M8LH75_9MICO|nr:Zn-dependent hydrolase [Cryobacterium tepidiphilum]RNE63974.1 Zn-dependent hydrolase [Cryobacterium tepidiphilum]
MTRADAGRIAAHLEELSRIGDDPRGGFSRLVYTEPERRAHAAFRGWLDGYGLQTSTDSVGNSFGVLPGSEDLPYLMSGSHLDSVYQGGNFDGAAGVVAAVEIARILAEDGGLRHPFRVVAFAGEEGARFGAPCIGSRLMTGAFSEDTLRQLTDRDDVTAWDAARSVGLKPEATHLARWDPAAVACFVEIHIEQGRVLEARDRQLGVVHTIGGSTRVELTFEGRADHSGATPMWLRRDALAAAGEFIGAVERRAQRHATTVATVGTLEVQPGSLTTVPGRVVLGLDVRDIDSERQRELTETLLDDALRIASGREIQVTARQLSDQSPVVLHGSVQNVLAAAATRQELSFISMASGASHDSAHIAKQVPTGMVFVPCREGISHAPEEHAEPEHLAQAVDVVVDAFRAIDAGASV